LASGGTHASAGGTGKATTRDPPILKALFRTVRAYAGLLKLSVDCDGSVATLRIKDHDTGDFLGAIHATKYRTEDGREAVGLSAWLAGGVGEERASLVRKVVRKLEKAVVLKRTEKRAGKSIRVIRAPQPQSHSCADGGGAHAG
jgi:hypothetical protein